MDQGMGCNHVSPVVVNPVRDGGWLARCLRCGTLGQVGDNSVEALDLLQRDRGKSPAGVAQARRYHETYRELGGRGE